MYQAFFLPTDETAHDWWQRIGQNDFYTFAARLSDLPDVATKIPCQEHDPAVKCQLLGTIVYSDSAATGSGSLLKRRQLNGCHGVRWPRALLCPFGMETCVR
jgi:hypothetical protein